MTHERIFAPGLLAGRTASVTAGGTGIGLAIAEELGGLGARVILGGQIKRRGLGLYTGWVDQ
ncbi:hypothetical protein [Rhodospirillaceae bacterium SYSU D60014]|uniref:hypothetical protein n=1 Tax=Virgifigura deserti TaxID=2268457 RepID=UPI000E675D56